MKSRTPVLCAAVLSAACAALAADEGPPEKPWWQRGADTWYYKDDWKALAISGGRAYTKTIRLSAEPASGWIIVWGARGYKVRVNDRAVGASVDGCLIDDYDLAGELPQSKEITLRIEGPKVCAEGEIVDRAGKRYPFATGADWQVPGRPNAKLRTEKVPTGPSHGAFHRAHNARLTTYNAEQRAKTAIAKCFARIQRLREQGFFLMKRFRPAEEILSFDEDLPWREAEVLAGRQLEMAEKVLQAGAVPAETDGRHSEAVTAAGQAAAAITAAESAVQAATDVYRAEREAVHLGNVSNIKGVADLLEPDIAEFGRLSKAARRAFAERDWASVRKAIGRHAQYAQGVRARLEAIAAQAGEALIGGVGRLDEFPEDRFGWLNARELMGNDPVNWPCCVWPSDSEWIDLAGKWDFRIDPNNVGEKQKWPSGHGEQWGQLVVPRAWERQGITADNRKAPNAPIGGRAGRETTGRDKPYNGFAWYRKRVLVPRTWKGKPLRLRLGRVENWCRVFLNGQAIGTLERAGEGRRLGPADVVTIPPAAVDFGRENLLCLQVYNHDNFGGIVSGPVALHVDDARPSFRETPGPLSFAQEYTWKTPRGPVRQTLFIGAMSPGVVMVREDDLLELRGWRAKGTGSADALVFETGANLRVVRLDKPRRIDPAAVTGGWFSVAGRSVRVVIVPGRRPKSVTWQANVPGGGILRFQFDRPAVRVAIVSLPPEVEMRKGHYDFWVSALASYPVSASQCVWMAKGINGSQTPRPATRPAAPMRQYVTEYEYLKLGNAPELQTWKFAPLPMLLSFALSHGMTVRVPPGAVRSTGYSSQYCRYLMARDDGTFYDYPAPDRSKMMKGVGELFARSEAARNVHGGLGEREMFRRMGEWGFDHCRYALAFDAKWDLPLMEHIGGPITDDEKLWRRLDELVKNCNDAGLQMMLCSFPEIESRKWLADPRLQKNMLEFWRRIARRYAHLPKWAISYDPFNEPAYMNTDHWNRIMKELTRIIRSVDKTHTIVWESADGWAQPHWCLWMQPVEDDNVIYSFHHYGKHWGYAYDEYYPGYQCTRERTQIHPWLEAILFGLKHNVPIHCGEFGLSMLQPAGDGEKWLNDYLALFERFGIGWNWWNYSGDNIYRTGLAAEERISPYVPILIKWMNRSGWGKARREKTTRALVLQGAAPPIPAQARSEADR